MSAAALLNLLPDPACRCSEDGRIRSVNRAWTDLLGTPVDVYAVLDPEGAARLREGWGGGTLGRVGLVAGQRADGEVVVLDDGDRVLVLRVAPSHPLAALGDGERGLATLVEQAQECVFVKDLDGRYRYINAAGARMIDRTPDAVLGRTDADIFLPETAAQIQEIDRFVASSHESYTYQTTRRDFGAPRVFLTTRYPYRDASGRVIGTMGTSQDVTALVTAHEQARQADASFRALVERVPDIVLVHVDGTVRYANPAARLALGTDADDLLGRPLACLVAGTHHEVLASRIAARAAGDDLAPVELHLLDARGEAVAAEVVDVEVHWEGRPALALVARDLTERRRLESRLAEADRLATVGIMSAAVAHEVNNPLSLVRYHLDVLSRELGARLAPDDDLLDRVGTAVQGAERIEAIVHGLTTFARTHSDEVEAVDVVDVLERASSLAAPMVRHRAQVVRAHCGAGPARARRGRLGQVFLNLLVNAAQALPVGDAERHRITLRTEQADGWIVVSVSDTGPGISDRARPHVFERSFTTKPVGEGSGLGLWLSRGLVEEMGGRIELSTGPDGTTFSVFLPVAGPVVASRPVVAQPVGASARPRVLVIDDEPGVCDLLRDALSSIADVRTFTRARDALAALGSGEPAPDVVLCDLMMPDMAGMQLYATLREADPSLARRTLFLTGGAFTAEGSAFVQAHPDRVFRKPIRLAELQRAILRLSGGR